MSILLRRIKNDLHSSQYAVAHWVRDSMPFLWNMVEHTNATLFNIRYAHLLNTIEQEAVRMAEPYEMVSIAQLPTDQLVDFFRQQPADLYHWFTPHGFEEADIVRLQKNASFLAYVLKKNGVIVGYFFIRCFNNGECYFGRLVDYRYMRQGIGTLMNKVSFYISESLHMESFQTIAKGNIASIKSCTHAYRLQPIRTIANGDILYKNCKL